MEKFRQFLIENNRQPRTVLRHLSNIGRILEHCPNFTREEIDAYYIHLKDRGIKNTYWNSMVSTIRVYAQLLEQEDLQHTKFKKREEFAKAVMSDEEIEAFLTLEQPLSRRVHSVTGKEYWCKANPKNWEIWRVFFSIWAYTGMRPGEVANLEVNGVDFGLNIFTSHGKTGNVVSPISTNIRQMVLDYVNNLPTGETLLFKSRKNGNKDGVTPVFDNVDWHYNFHRRIKLMDIRRTNLTPYSLRHSYATSLLDTEEVNLFAVKNLMHHRDLKSTMVYYHMTYKTMQKAASKHPNVQKTVSALEKLQYLSEAIDKMKLDNDLRLTERFKKCLKDIIYEESSYQRSLLLD